MKPLHFPFAVTLVGAAVGTLAPAVSAEFNLAYTTVLEGELIRDGERIRATAIPYHLWSNRGAGEMTVWLNTVPAQTL